MPDRPAASRTSYGETYEGPQEAVDTPWGRILLPTTFQVEQSREIHGKPFGLVGRDGGERDYMERSGHMPAGAVMDTSPGAPPVIEPYDLANNPRWEGTPQRRALNEHKTMREVMPDPKPQPTSFYDAYQGLGPVSKPVVTPPFRAAGMEVGPAPPVYGPGNINLSNRPEVRNGDDVSTVRSMSANIDGREVLMPTVSEDARIMSDDEAIRQYIETGRYLGKFDTPAQADDYAQQLHMRQSTLPQANPVPDRSKGRSTKRKRRAVP